MYYHLPRVTIQTSGGKESSYFSILERVFHAKFQRLISIDQIIVVQVYCRISPLPMQSIENHSRDNRVVQKPLQVAA